MDTVLILLYCIVKHVVVTNMHDLAFARIESEEPFVRPKM